MNMKNIACIALAAVLLGCAAEKGIVPPPLQIPPRAEEPTGIIGTPGAGGSTETRVSPTPKPPPAPATKAEATAPKAPATPEQADVSFNFEQIPLPRFIEHVYGTILKRNVSIDPTIVARQDLVTVRTGGPQTPSQVADAARILLKSYGIAVIDLGGIVRVVPDNASTGYMPEIRRGRALPDAPAALRPVFQLVELQAVRNTDVATWIRTMFGNKLTVSEDPSRNAVWIGGASDEINAALDAIRTLDQPLMRGRHSLRITPVFMSAEELARRLTDILQAEGYSAGPPGAVALPVNLVPIPAINAVIVFAGDDAIVQHVASWAKDLDKPDATGIGRNLFSYKVQYSDAQALANTLEKVLSGSPPRAGTTAGTAGAAAATPVAPHVVVDQPTNTIIFQGSSEDYGQIRNLLQLLDRPTNAVLIEVTVAELSLNDNSQLGVEWQLRNLTGTGSTVAGTLGGLGIGTAGFNYSRIDNVNDRTLLLNALASNNRATILSSPRIVARNGEIATIQVGQEVPIITSQQTTPVTGNTGILQTVQYRSTGVILKVRPVIHSGNEIDLDVSQEVSAAQSTTTGVATSPTFGTRKVETKLSLKEGSTVLLGGLISDDRSSGDAGIPLLKNIPIIGQAFRTNTWKGDRTELIILITPYIIANDTDAKAVTDAFRKQLGDWARDAQTTPSGSLPEKGIGTGHGLAP